MTEKYQQKLELARKALIHNDYESANLYLKELSNQFPNQAPIFSFLVEYTNVKSRGGNILDKIAQPAKQPIEQYKIQKNVISN